MRKPHVLTTARRKTFPERVIYFDCEAETEIEITDEDVQRARSAQQSEPGSEAVKKQHRIYAICATYLRDKSRFGRPDVRTRRQYYPRPQELGSEREFDFVKKFWKEVDGFASERQTLWMFAHNAKYDVQVTQAIPHLVDLGYVVKASSGDNPMFVLLEKPGVSDTIKINIVSTTNYYQQSLKSLGDTFNLPKLDFDHGTKIEMSDPKFVKTMLEYAVRDVDIIDVAMTALIKFIRDEELGTFKMTIAGQSFAAFITRFMMHDIHIHSDPTALRVERNAYSGGRNECFRLGRIKKKIYYLDINSMYPYVMWFNKYPTKLVTTWRDPNIESVMQMIDAGYAVCADVRVKTDLPIYPKKDKRLLFPTGTFNTSLSTPELIEAYKRGHIVEITTACIYEAHDIFSNFVDYFYGNRLKAREEGNDVYAFLFKLILNCLYGKFGQKSVEWFTLCDEDGEEIEIDPRIIDTDTVYYEETGQVVMRRMFGGRIQEQNKDSQDIEAFNSFPAIAAHVTAFARILLWGYIEKAGLSHVYYCDTDSVFVDEDAYRRLVESGAVDKNRLGALKLEDEAEDFEIFGCKDYIFAGKTKMKGVSKTAKPLGYDRDGHLQFAVVQWGGFAERFKERNFTDYYNKIIIKTLKREYNKGDVQANGEVKPFVLNEEERRTIMEKTLTQNQPKFDPLRDKCQEIGFIRTPLQGEFAYGEYKDIDRKYKTRYFRVGSGLPVDEWCDEAGLSVRELFDRLNRL